MVLVGAVAAFGFGFALVSGGGSSSTALDCPTNPALATACGSANLVIATVCHTPAPDIPTIGFVTIKIEGRLPVYCPPGV
ncbi:MAG: hypothetical protein Q8K63_04090 [Acidimicrobiales bacterium]|nr:hypothetical protein [Acidimicrobiales bacterium]